MSSKGVLIDGMLSDFVGRWHRDCTKIVEWRFNAGHVGRTGTCFIHDSLLLGAPTLVPLAMHFCWAHRHLLASFTMHFPGFPDVWGVPKIIQGRPSTFIPSEILEWHLALANLSSPGPCEGMDAEESKSIYKCHKLLYACQ